jgi:hypothetical protein
VYGSREVPRAMIKNDAVARQISDLMIEISGRLDASIVTVEENCSSEEFKIYRRAVGSILGEILLEVMNPLYKEHPSLKPPGFE